MLGDREYRIAWALIGCLYVALLVVLVQEIQGEGNPADPGSGKQGKDGLPDVFIGLTATGWTAVFTFVLTGVAVWQIVLWARSNRTSEQALRSSEQSTKALVSSERAWIEVVGMRMDRSESNDVLGVPHIFQNIGRSPGVVTGRSYFVSTQDRGVLPPMPPPSIGSLSINDRFTIPPGRTWGFGEANNLPPLLVRDPEVISGLDDVYAGRLDLYVQGHVKYDSVSGVTYVNIFCLRFDSERQGFGPIPDRSHNFHGPLNAQDI